MSCIPNKYPCHHVNRQVRYSVTSRILFLGLFLYSLFLRNLHWLPVRSRIDYKISTLCFNTFTNSPPVCSLKNKLLHLWLLFGSHQFILDKLQREQMSATRLVMKSRKCDHVQPLLRSLLWLPVHSRIDYKISTLCFNTSTNSSPVYIA